MTVAHLVFRVCVCVMLGIRYPTGDRGTPLQEAQSTILSVNVTVRQCAIVLLGGSSRRSASVIAVSAVRSLIRFTQPTRSCEPIQVNQFASLRKTFNVITLMHASFCLRQCAVACSFSVEEFASRISQQNLFDGTVRSGIEHQQNGTRFLSLAECSGEIHSAIHRLSSLCGRKLTGIERQRQARRKASKSPPNWTIKR